MIMEELKKIAVIVGAFMVGVLITAIIMYKPAGEKNPKENKEVEKNQQAIIKEKTEISVSEKKNSNEPDVVIVTKYVADVNGQKVEAPLKTEKDKTTATVTTTIDVTPILDKMRPNWEVGVGVGTDKDFAISVQRNYKKNRSIEAISIIDKKGKVSKGYLLHKWSF